MICLLDGNHIPLGNYMVNIQMEGKQGIGRGDTLLDAFTRAENTMETPEERRKRQDMFYELHRIRLDTYNLPVSRNKRTTLADL